MLTSICALALISPNLLDKSEISIVISKVLLSALQSQ